MRISDEITTLKTFLFDSFVLVKKHFLKDPLSGILICFMQLLKAEQMWFETEPEPPLLGNSIIESLFLFKNPKAPENTI